MKDDKILQITMFGDFTMTYGDVSLKLERTNTTKAMHALQLLIYHGEQGIVRNTLLELLYGDDHAIEPANNLKVTISNLRRLLMRAGLPAETSIFYRSGSYYWRSSVPVTLDTEQFSRAVTNAQTATKETKQASHYLAACHLYTGGFLPHLQTESWAAAAAAAYRETYFACIRRLTELLSRAKRWEELLAAATQAAQLYGVEELQQIRIDCLMNLQRYAEAKQVYEETVHSLREDYDLGPSEALLERCRALDAMACKRTDTIQEFQQTLTENVPERGAYYCAYPGFIDAYRVVSRMLERNGQSAYLILCRLTDGKGCDIAHKDKLTEAVPRAAEAIRKALRRGDLFTQPARDRFLILLVGTNRENCSIVTARILEEYHEAPARGVSLRFKLAPVGDVMEQEMFRQKPSWSLPAENKPQH